jgi:hypothetical protein
MRQLPHLYHKLIPLLIFCYSIDINKTHIYIFFSSLIVEGLRGARLMAESGSAWDNAYSLSDMSWEIPLALLLISCNWWENFCDKVMSNQLDLQL